MPIFNVNLSEILGCSFKLDLDPDMPVESDLLFYLTNNQIPEPELVHAIAKFLKPGDVAVDGGANVGFFTMCMAQRVGPTGKVIAFEPDKRNLARLHNMIEINKLTNVEVRDVALWCEPTNLEFDSFEHSGSTTCKVGHADSVRFVARATTLDIEWAKLSIPSIHFIKLDIEGAEMDAIKGGMSMIKLCAPVIVVEANKSLASSGVVSIQQLRNIMAKHDYDAYRLDELGRYPAKCPVNKPVISSRDNCNLLLSPWHRVAKSWSEFVL